MRLRDGHGCLLPYPLPYPPPTPPPLKVAVGVYFPAVGGMRSTHLPDAQRGTLTALSRVPLNLLVVAVALGRERLGTAGALRCAAAALAAAAMLAYSLSRHASPSKGKKV